jgi:hypothetical protein
MTQLSPDDWTDACLQVAASITFDCPGNLSALVT